MFETLGVEEDDATIIEVEGGTCTLVMFDSMPGFPITEDAFDDDDGLLVKMRIKLL
jgi:hypothetical protein